MSSESFFGHFKGSIWRKKTSDVKTLGSIFFICLVPPFWWEYKFSVHLLNVRIDLQNSRFSIFSSSFKHSNRSSKFRVFKVANCFQGFPTMSLSLLVETSKKKGYFQQEYGSSAWIINQVVLGWENRFIQMCDLRGIFIATKKSSYRRFQRKPPYMVNNIKPTHDLLDTLQSSMK